MRVFKQLLKNIAILSLLFWLAGCAGFGSHKGQTCSPPYPKNGKIVNNIYYTPVVSFQNTMMGFSVRVPWNRTPACGRLLEGYDLKHGLYVVFGPTTDDYSIDRIALHLISPNQPFGPLAQHIVADTAQEMQSVYGTPAIKLAERDELLQGRPAHFALYQQKVGDTVLTQIVYVVHEHLALIRFWITSVENSPRNSVDGLNRWKVLHGTWPPMTRLLNSLRITFL